MASVNRNIDYSQKVVEMKNITKKFGNFTANDNIDLTVHKGEVHALLGENGAGKSTLMNILYGLYQQTSGEIYIKGKKTEMDNPNVAIQNGIGMVHQHFMLIHTFTVAQNIVLGMEPTKGLGALNMDKAIGDVREISKRYGLHVDPMAKVEDISVGMQQRVEILKALYRGAEILILDEPTAVLTPQEINELMQIIRNLTKEGKSVIIITHKLKEIKAAADHCTIIRRGKYIDTVNVSDTTEDDLAAMMVGREVTFKVEKEESIPKDIVLKIENLNAKDNRQVQALRDFSLEVKAGEIVGIAGVDGNGQSELIEVLTGLRKAENGSIKINGQELINKTPIEIFKNGVKNIPEDRQKRGLILDFTVEENMVLQNYKDDRFSKNGVLKEDSIKEHADYLIKRFDVRPTDSSLKARSLSGGNQQKIIIGREVDNIETSRKATNKAQLLIATQPTRGLDVGAIEFVHKSLIQQRDAGNAVLLVSFELDEVMNVSDKIAVIYEGQIVGVVDAKDADENTLGFMMAGGEGHE
jgi:general nucleoside transport system ATP-binding protein